jgi:hypothetical protein
VTRVPPVHQSITEAIRRQLAHGRYAPSALYGDGHVAVRIAQSVAVLQPYVQKRLHYVFEGIQPAQRGAAASSSRGNVPLKAAALAGNGKA